MITSDKPLLAIINHYQSYWMINELIMVNNGTRDSTSDFIHGKKTIGFFKRKPAPKMYRRSLDWTVAPQPYYIPITSPLYPYVVWEPLSHLRKIRIHEIYINCCQYITFISAISICLVSYIHVIGSLWWQHIPSLISELNFHLHS